MARFSLIVATFNRTKEFTVLLQSLAEQEMDDFELIVVDQNPDDRLVSVLQNWTSRFAEHRENGARSIRVKHLRCAPGVSRARNLGLSHSEGDILAFPDDDCWYYPDTLRKVNSWFIDNEAYGILSLGCRDEQGRLSGNRWAEAECDIKMINVFRTSGTCCFFVRRPNASIPLRFDESLGPGAGTQFGAGEDTDFLLSLMSHGIRGRFYSVMHIGHPVKVADAKRAENYGGGWGRVLAKHSLRWLFLGFVGFDFTRAALRMACGDRHRAAYLWAHGLGMIRAYFSGRG